MFRSYAQNFEDVILWRALKHVDNGFYIDIGAQHPRIDSVSLGFYEKGWRGVHAEPNAEYAGLLRQDRPDETVLETIIGNSPAPMTFYTIEGTGLSTADEELAVKYKEEGIAVIETTVPVISLENVLTGVDSVDIHWLKIDVEGMEGDVLASWGDCDRRPWILCIESTYPNTQIPTHEHWEHHVLSRGYEFVYFDGLSRFYVSEGARSLRSHFGPGPNVFDNFVLNRASGLVDNQPPDPPAQEVDGVAGTGMGQTEELSGISRELERVGNALESIAVDSANAGAGPNALLQEERRQVSQEGNHLAAIGQETARLATYVDRITGQYDTLSLKIDQLERELDRSKADYERKMHELWLESVELRKSRDSLVQSRSWRVTRPLRALYSTFKPGEPSAAGGGVAFVSRTLSQFPATRRTLVKLVSRAPALERFLRQRHAASISVPLASDQGRHLGGAINMVQLNAPARSARSQMFLSQFEAIAGQRHSLT